MNMATAITIRERKVKTFKDVSIQLERIVTLYMNGYGNDRMMGFCEEVYFKALKKNGGY